MEGRKDLLARQKDLDHHDMNGPFSYYKGTILKWVLNHIFLLSKKEFKVRTCLYLIVQCYGQYLCAGLLLSFYDQVTKVVLMRNVFCRK